MSSTASKFELYRWVLVDEIDSVGAEVCGELVEKMTAAARRRWHTYRGANEAHVLSKASVSPSFADFWQPPLVRQQSICSYPKVKASGPTMDMFWRLARENDIVSKNHDLGKCAQPLVSSSTRRVNVWGLHAACGLVTCCH